MELPSRNWSWQMKWKVYFWWRTHHNPFSNVMVLCWCFIYNFFDLSLKKKHLNCNWLISFVFRPWSTTSNRRKSSLLSSHPLFSFLSWNGPKTDDCYDRLVMTKKSKNGWVCHQSWKLWGRGITELSSIHLPPILFCLVFFLFPIHFKLTQLLFQGQL